MKKSPTNTPASVLARLKNLAERDHLDFNFLLLQSAIQKTFARREASLHSAAQLLQSNLGEQASLQNLWRAFFKRSHLVTKEDFKEIFQSIRAFVGPIIDAATAGKPMSLNWDRSTKEWR